MAAVSGVRGTSWHMTVAYEPDDTYTVWLMRDSARRPLCMPEVLASLGRVNSDDLQHAVESIYDEAIKTRKRDIVHALNPVPARAS